MSEAELHVLKARLLGGQRNKARRRELEMSLPIGLVYDAAGAVVLDPDQQIQQSIRSIFDTFWEQADKLRASQLERARYDAELARLRYLKVDPDNRLVADSLEAD
jgi:DNA invertase Pin-like site-specific DNA recombinase